MGSPRGDDAGATRHVLRIDRLGPAAGLRLDVAQTDGKIFAMLVNGRFVVKLDRRRVDALVASGDGERFDPGHGRLMKEWLAVESASDEAWLSLAMEAEAFVAKRGGPDDD